MVGEQCRIKNQGGRMRKIIFCVLAFSFFPSLLLFAQEEEVVLTITTPQAEYDAETGKIVAQVSTFTWQDVKVVCPFLEIDTQTQEARSEGNISISWSDFQAQARALYYQGKENRLNFLGIEGSNPEIRFSTGEAFLILIKKALSYLVSSFGLARLGGQGSEYRILSGGESLGGSYSKSRERRLAG